MCTNWYSLLYNRIELQREKLHAVTYVPNDTITKTRLFKYIENFTTQKGKFSDKKISDIFHIPAQNIDCGYSVVPKIYVSF